MGGLGETRQPPREKTLGVSGNYIFKQPVLVARRTGSGTGPTVGATDLVAVLRQVQLGWWGIVGGRPKP